MKKVAFLLFAGFACVAVFVVAITTKSQAKANTSSNKDYLRIHIRANSNSSEDQTVKYKVKECIVEFLTPLVCNAKDQAEAKQIVAKNLTQIQSIANSVLESEGFSYGSTAEIKTENFPSRTYENKTLEAGEYDALILELGSGTGDNWWCVVFPPLCFANAKNNGSNNIIYRSKFVEIIQKYNN